MRSVRAAKEAIAQAKACKMAEEKRVSFEKILKELGEKRKTFDDVIKSQNGGGFAMMKWVFENTKGTVIHKALVKDGWRKWLCGSLKCFNYLEKRVMHGSSYDCVLNTVEMCIEDEIAELSVVCC
jgi:hypothetical protein